MRSQLDTAYSVCRGIARSAARNFYYAFLVLPREKRDALSAVYAFMRHADDVADDPRLSPEEKQSRLSAWVENMHRVFAGQPTDEPVLFALADAQRRFEVPPELLEQLVQGTAADAKTEAGSRGPAVLYQTFEELYAYCYRVAAVVGLVTIKVFGYRDPAAEPLAERCGVAFQLTNILRDVKEDAGLGRVYLPASDLAAAGWSEAAIAAPPAEAMTSAALAPVLRLQAERARELYRAADQLLPLLDEDARPAFWTLAEIYQRLLGKIERRNFDVFRERVRLTAWEKLGILFRGMYRRLTA